MLYNPSANSKKPYNIKPHVVYTYTTKVKYLCKLEYYVSLIEFLKKKNKVGINRQYRV